MHVVCPDGIPEYRDMIAPMIEAARPHISNFDWYDGRPPDPGEYVRRTGNAAGIILMWDLPAEAMERCPGLKIVSFAGVGAAKYVNLDLASRRGIMVCNTPGYGDNAVAEHSVALMFAAARRVARLDRTLRRGEWVQPPMMELRGKTLGLVGLGGIGRRMAELAGLLGMRVLCWTQNPSGERAREAGVEFVSLEELFRRSDVVSLHLKHLPETEKLVGERELSLMKPGSILINTARGEIVDTAALIAALQNGPLAGAGLDVFDQEPLPGNHPLCALENVTLTPHIGYNTPEASANLLQMTVDNIVAYQKGTPVNVVNPRGPA